MEYYSPGHMYNLSAFFIGLSRRNLCLSDTYLEPVVTIDNNQMLFVTKELSSYPIAGELIIHALRQLLKSDITVDWALRQTVLSLHFVHPQKLIFTHSSTRDVV